MKRIVNEEIYIKRSGLALLIIRLGFGLMMISHGYDKMHHFSEYEASFMNFLGLSKGVSLGLIIFAELFCAVFVVLGLFTRYACVILIIGMLVATSVMKWDIFAHAETAAIYVVGYLAILFAGPGRYSVDALLLKEHKHLTVNSKIISR